MTNKPTITMQKKSYRLKAGNLANMKIIPETLSEPTADEVMVEVKAIGLNFADIFAIWGLYSATPEHPITPGLEYSGIVLKTGGNVKNVKEGDRVMGVTKFGAYTSHLNIDHHYVTPMPDDWSFAEGAAFLVQVLTAYYALVYLGNLTSGQTILIHSAAGGVGILANRIAKKFDAYTIGTVGRPDKLDFLKKEGYDHAIVRSGDFKADLEKALQDRELNLIMECIGGQILKIGYEKLVPQGRMIVYGSARYASVGNRPNYLKLIWKFLTRPKIDPQKMIESNKSIMGFNLIHLYEKANLMNELLVEINKLNLPAPHVGHTFPFEKLPEAIRLFQSGKTIGKVVIEI